MRISLRISLILIAADLAIVIRYLRCYATSLIVIATSSSNIRPTGRPSEAYTTDSDFTVQRRKNNEKDSRDNLLIYLSSVDAIPVEFLFLHARLSRALPKIFQ